MSQNPQNHWVFRVLWLPATIVEKLGIQGSLLQDLARKGFCWNRIVKISYLTFFCWWWFLIAFGVVFSWRYSSNDTKYSEFTSRTSTRTSSARRFAYCSQRAVEVRDWQSARSWLRCWRDAGVEWFSSRSWTYSVCIYAVLYIHVIYYTYIHISYAKGPWKGFALGGPRGMQWAVSAKVFSEMA